MSKLQSVELARTGRISKAKAEMVRTALTLRSGNDI